MQRQGVRTTWHHFKPENGEGESGKVYRQNYEGIEWNEGGYKNVRRLNTEDDKSKLKT